MVVWIDFVASTTPYRFSCKPHDRQPTIPSVLSCLYFSVLAVTAVPSSLTCLHSTPLYTEAAHTELNKVGSRPHNNINISVYIVILHQVDQNMGRILRLSQIRNRTKRSVIPQLKLRHGGKSFSKEYMNSYTITRQGLKKNELRWRAQ